MENYIDLVTVREAVGCRTGMGNKKNPESTATVTPVSICLLDTPSVSSDTSFYGTHTAETVNKENTACDHECVDTNYNVHKQIEVQKASMNCSTFCSSYNRTALEELVLNANAQSNYMARNVSNEQHVIDSPLKIALLNACGLRSKLKFHDFEEFV